MSNLSYCTRCERLLCYGAHYELGGARRCFHCATATAGTLRNVTIRGLLHDTFDPSAMQPGLYGESRESPVGRCRMIAVVYTVAGRKGYFVRDTTDNRFLRPLPTELACRVALTRQSEAPRPAKRSSPRTPRAMAKRP